jgi:hypothetical protein
MITYICNLITLNELWIIHYANEYVRVPTVPSLKKNLSWTFYKGG